MNSRFQKSRQGFTLMEIMVVVIVIAVLASIAGPVFNQLTDEAKAAATKAGMQNIKSALVNFNNDVGKFPFIADQADEADNYGIAADAYVLGTSVDTNVLVSDTVGDPYKNLGIEAATYAKRWKGPYMDSDPERFMFDAWESKIRYQIASGALYLHSYGPDGVDDFENCLTNGYEGDDIVISISRGRFK